MHSSQSATSEPCDSGLYEAFFGLDRRPFQSAPDPEFLYFTPAHEAALTMLRFGLMADAPITVLTGGIGTGKTTLLRRLLREIPGDRRVAMIANIGGDSGDILRWALMALGHECTPNAAPDELYRQFRDLTLETCANGQRTVLIFDEAQNLDARALEELRMLSNLNADNAPILQIVLAGQSQLRDLLDDPGMSQFSQRIAADADLAALSLEETAGYIHHRLAVAGATQDIFLPAAVALVHQATAGVPRLINLLCDLTLLHAFADALPEVSEATVQAVLSNARRRGTFRLLHQSAASPALVATPVTA
ncbi:MAG: ExeA family protein [Paracoccaceae bacterium]